MKKLLLLLLMVAVSSCNKESDSVEDQSLSIEQEIELLTAGADELPEVDFSSSRSNEVVNFVWSYTSDDRARVKAATKKLSGFDKAWMRGSYNRWVKRTVHLSKKRGAGVAIAWHVKVHNWYVKYFKKRGITLPPTQPSRG